MWIQLFPKTLFLSFIKPQNQIFLETIKIQVSSTFQNFSLHHFVFTRDPHQDLFSLTKRNPKRTFTFYQKSQKVKIVFSVCFAGSHYRGSCARSSQSGTAKLFPQEPYTASQLQATTALNCVRASMPYLHLFCVFISKMCPKVIASLFYAILAYKSLHRNALLSDSWRNLYLFI